MTFVAGRSGRSAAKGSVPIRSVESPNDGQSEREKRLRAVRRARAASRRYIKHNRLDILVTLTYRPDESGLTSRSRCMGDGATFFRKVRATSGRMPYWYTAELHPDGHGHHLHALLPHRLPPDLLARCWPHGRVDQPSGNYRYAGRSGTSPHPRAEAAADYCMKDWGTQKLGPGERLYRAAQGYRPEKIEFDSRSLSAALQGAADALDGCPLKLSDSSGWEGWDGPPVYKLTSLR